MFGNYLLRTFVGMDNNYITVQQLAAHLGISVRAAHWHLKHSKKKIPGVAAHVKLADKKTSPYLITPDASYFTELRKRKKAKCQNKKLPL